MILRTGQITRLSDRRPASDDAQIRFGTVVPFRNENTIYCSYSAFLHIEAMQATLSVSGRGLIALPSAMRKAAGISPKDSIIAETTPEGILLRPAVTLPVEIYSTERIAEFDAAEADLAAWYAKRK